MILTLLLALWLAPPPAKPAAEAEEDELQQALAETNGSVAEYARVLERHLEKHPQSAQRKDIERVLVQAGIDAKDSARMLRYGPAVIERGSRDGQVLLETTRALLDAGGAERAAQAERFAGYLKAVLDADLAKMKAERGKLTGQGKRYDDIRALIGRTLALEARALGGQGKPEDAARRAEAAWTLYPAAETARERAFWLERTGALDKAVEALADAFAIPDGRANEAQRRADRQRLGELYARWKPGAAAGLGDIVLAAYDRGTKLIDARGAEVRKLDPNFGAAEVREFTLSELGGGSVALASLRGQVVVLDFWATWCGPCRAQHPLYEQAKARYQGRADVVFLSVNTDEDRSAVEPFLKANNWRQQVYFDDGLGAFLRLNSIPMTLILNRAGAVSARMNGFVPERFVEMLSQRIEQALGEK